MEPTTLRSKHQHLLTSLLLNSVVVLCVSVAFGQKVDVGFERDIDFKQFKTYSWAPLDPVRMPYLRLTIVSAIDTQLSQKGLMKVNNDGDVLVAYSSDMAIEASHGVSAPSYPGYAGPPPSTSSTMWTGSGTAGSVAYPKGTLVVELMDPHLGRIAWRAVGRLKLDMERKSDSLNKVNDMIVRMFEKYPPAK
jgi:hypothetical protein